MAFCRADSDRILGRDSQPLRLRGVNLGGWLLWEGWIIGGGYNGETAMTKRLAKIVGSARSARFKTQMRDAFVTQADLDAIRAAGFDHVRVPFNHLLLETDEQPFVYSTGGWARLDRLLEMAERAGVLVILDLHAAPGSQTITFMADYTGAPDLWGDRKAQDRTVALWQAIAGRYRDREVILGYDLLGEPACTWQPEVNLPGLYRRVTAAIREVDPSHAVIVEGNWASHDFSMLGRIDDNQVYSPHQYTVPRDDFSAQLDGWIAKGRADGVPVWIGEWGETDPVTGRAQRDLFASKPGLAGWCYWTWKTGDTSRSWGVRLESNKHPVRFTVTDAWDRLVEYLGGQGSEPTAEQAEQGMAALVAAVRYERCGRDAQMTGIAAA
jgi:endoglucanase